VKIADARRHADDHLDYFLACTDTDTPEGNTT
jgi:hypothetical protein